VTKKTAPRIRIVLLATGMLLAVVSCEVSSPALKPAGNDGAKASADSSVLAMADLQVGYKLFVMNCSGCHSLYEPASRPRDHWERLLPEMLGKAKLDSAQGALVKHYIFSKL